MLGFYTLLERDYTPDEPEDEVEAGSAKPEIPDSTLDEPVYTLLSVSLCLVFLSLTFYVNLNNPYVTIHMLRVRLDTF